MEAMEERGGEVDDMDVATDGILEVQLDVDTISRLRGVYTSLLARCNGDHVLLRKRVLRIDRKNGTSWWLAFHGFMKELERFETNTIDIDVRYNVHAVWCQKLEEEVDSNDKVGEKRGRTVL